MKKPKQLYLQWYGDADEQDKEHIDKHGVELSDVTWANEKVFQYDLGPYKLEMTEEKARELLGDRWFQWEGDSYIEPTGRLVLPRKAYTPEQLRAYAWWLENRS